MKSQITRQSPYKGNQKQKMENFLLSNMSHFPSFYDDFSYRNLTLKIGYFILR